MRLVSVLTLPHSGFNQAQKSVGALESQELGGELLFVQETFSSKQAQRSHYFQ